MITKCFKDKRHAYKYVLMFSMYRFNMVTNLAKGKHHQSDLSTELLYINTKYNKKNNYF